MENAELLIPIVAIIMTMGVPIAWFYFMNRSKEARYRAMERMAQAGQDPKMLERLLADERVARPNRRQPYRSGLICLAIGAAFMFTEEAHYNDGPPRWVGLLMLFIGAALILSDFMNRGQARKDRDDYLAPRDPNQPL